MISPSWFVRIFQKIFSALLIALSLDVTGQKVITYPMGEFKNVDRLMENQCADDPFICELIDTYAPKFIFHPNEKFYPSTIDFFLEYAKLGYRYSRKKTSEILPIGKVNGSNLGTQIHGDRGDKTAEEIRRHHPSFTKSRSRGEYYVEVVGDQRDRILRGMNPERFDQDLLAYVNYGKLYNPDSVHTGYQLQYWLFFPNNGSIGFHEGDWEGIAVTVDTEGRFIYASYMGHGSSRSYLPEQVIFADSKGNEQAQNQMPDSVFTHPVVFISKSTHASYPEKKKHRRYIFITDRTKRGNAFNSTGRVQLLPNKFMATGNLKWVQFSGRWGGRKSKWISSPEAAPYKWPYNKGSYFRHKAKGRKLKAQGRPVAATWNRMRFDPRRPLCDPENRWLLLFIHRDLREFYFAEMLRRDDPSQKFHNLDLYNFDNVLTGITECTTENDIYLLFEDINFGGKMTRSVPQAGPDIRHTKRVRDNDKTSSICWENCGEGSWVSFFKNKGFRGESYFLNGALESSVEDFSNTPLRRGTISSLRYCIPEGYKLVLYDRPNFERSELTLELSGTGSFAEMDFNTEHTDMENVIRSARIEMK